MDDTRAFLKSLKMGRRWVDGSLCYTRAWEREDLWIMLKNQIEWKCFMKTPPVYVGPSSCHDPVVKKAVFRGVGHRLRINSSKTEYFDEAVDTCSKSFAVAGYSYEHAKSELNKFRDENPVEMIKNGPKEKDSENVTGLKIFYFIPKDYCLCT